MVTRSAWDLIGFDGNLASVWMDGDWGPTKAAAVRIQGGRTLYEAVTFYDDTPGTHVKLSRLVAGSDGIRQIDRWVTPETILEIVES